METIQPGIYRSSPLFTMVCKETVTGIKFEFDKHLTVVYNCRRQYKKHFESEEKIMSKKTALVFTGKNGYQEMVVDDRIMTKDTLVGGRICYVLKDVKTFPQVDVEQTFGNVTAERTWIRFTFETSSKSDIRTLVRYAVGLDRFGGFPIQFKSHAGTMYITTGKGGKLSGVSKFLLKAMNNNHFDLKKVTVELIHVDGLLPTKTIVWSRKDCEQFTSNTDVTHAVQALRKAYSKGKLL